MKNINNTLISMVIYISKRSYRKMRASLVTCTDVIINILLTKSSTAAL